MPRTIDPGLIKKGSGMANQDSIDANAFTDEVIEGQTHALDAHVHDPKGAHPASAISTTTSGGLYDGTDVQSNLDELSSLIPPRPPTIGNFSNLVGFTGISDWGHLKLRDAGFVARGEVTSPDPTAPNNDFFVYPEFWIAPFVAGNAYDTPLSLNPNVRGNVFVPPGNDPITDPTFNIDPFGTADPTYTGGGPGQTHQGGFASPTGAVVETMRVLPSIGCTFCPQVVSGAVYPADRGVVALFHWPAFGSIPDFLAQPLEERVTAAILCGQGISDGCDGDPGGIFSEGSPDVFTFPGRATGQLDLSEIHSGINRITGNPLPPGPLPSAGQVRLGTDPAAGPVIPGGIPILGGTTISTGGGNDNNFFRYRLPYLDNYSSTDGLEYTPSSEKLRYFDKPLVSVAPATNLTQAGDFLDFSDDYWHFQVARYRHRFRFLTDVPGPPMLRLQGNYLLLHFKREKDFEAFARDGIMPNDFFAPYPLWGAGLVTYVPEESTDNLIDATTFLPPELATSLAYHSVRAAIAEDAPNPPISLGLAYTFTNEVDETMFVSGVQYLLPNGSGIGTNFAIDSLTASFTDLFNSSFRLGNLGGPTEVTPGLSHTNPLVLYLGGHTSQSNILNGLGVGYTGTAFYQRVDFGYEDLGSVSGPFDLSSSPSPFSTADVLLTGADVPITFSGDTAPCHFWQDARVRVFARKPLDQESAALYATEFLIPQPGGDFILFHTTDHSPTWVGVGEYGNFTLGGFGNPPRAGLETARKDVEERFFDEVYRVLHTALPPLDPTYNIALLIGNLVGPGLPFPPTPIELPVRFASESPFTFGFASYIQSNTHFSSLTAAANNTEAQVAGLPDRDPPVTDGVANPCPFAGRLIYPVTNYTAGFRPSLGAGDITVPQPDYSGIADTQRVYLRVFDAVWSNDPSPEFTVIGQPFLTFRIEGMELTDFAYMPGLGPGNSNIAIEIKVPGLTTWMDLGRRDGDGPSKQDPMTDGAGCQITNPVTTFNGRDAITGTVFAQVRINVGPAVNVFANSGAGPGPAPAGVGPIMMRVRMKLGSSLDFTQGGSTSTSDTPRALVGVTLLRKSDLTGPSSFGPPTPYP